MASKPCAYRPVSAKRELCFSSFLQQCQVNLCYFICKNLCNFNERRGIEGERNIKRFVDEKTIREQSSCCSIVK